MIMAATQSRTSTLPEGLRYYLLRGNIMVPLVPVDQLPFQLQSVPRQLTHRQMSDENWKLLQETDIISTPLSILAPSLLHSPLAIQPANNVPLRESTITPRARFLAPDHHVRTESASLVKETPQPPRWSVPLSPAVKAPEIRPAPQAAGPEHHVSLTDSLASIYPKDAQRFGYTLPYPSGIEPDPSKKEFCTHWIKTGECAFTSIGCKYKHEMPPVDKLRELGFTQVPKWWKEKSAIISRGPTWMQRRLVIGNEDNRILGEMSAPRAFPDPSTFRSRPFDDRGLPHGALQQRSILQKDAIAAHAQSLRPSPPPTPVPEPTVRRENQISNLIDLDEIPAPPPSPQLSTLSASSASSRDTQIHSSRTSPSPPPTFVPCELVPTTTDSAKPPVTASDKPKAQDPARLPLARHQFLLSWTSGAKDDTVPIKPLGKRKPAPRKLACRANAPTKQPGLANPKHAAVNSDLTSFPYIAVKNAARTLDKSGIAATEVRARLENVQWGRVPRPKGRGKKDENAGALVRTRQVPA
jgi:hypothetical protein